MIKLIKRQFETHRTHIPTILRLEARMEDIDIFARRRQQRVSESFEDSIRQTWPGGLIAEARKAIKNHDYSALDVVLQRLSYYS